MVSHELNKKRESIRLIIAEKLSILEKESFVELMTLLAEKLRDSDEDDEGVVIADLIDQYEIRMQSELEQYSEEIDSQMAKIKSLTNAPTMRGTETVSYEITNLPKQKFLLTHYANSI